MDDDDVVVLSVRSVFVSYNALALGLAFEVRFSPPPLIRSTDTHPFL